MYVCLEFTLEKIWFSNNTYDIIEKDLFIPDLKII